MTKVADHITENSSYLAEGTLAAIEGLTDNQFDTLVAAGDAVGLGEDVGVDFEVVKTHETLANFAESAKGWTECRYRDEYEANGSSIVHYQEVQMFKGQPRHSFAVIDFGDFRLVIK